MDHQMRFGHWGAAALFVLGLLHPSPTFPEEPPVPSPPLNDSAVEEMLPDPAAALPTVGDLDMRNQAVLEAIQRVESATHEALEHQSKIMGRQISELEEALAGQRERELSALLGSHQAIYRVTLLGASFFAATLFLLSLLSIRAMHRFSNRLAAPWSAWPKESGSQPTRPLPLPAVVRRLEKHILRLEQHLADPKRPRCVAEAPRLPAEAKMPDPKPLPQEPLNKSKPSPNHSQVPPLALALGAGESILFLPRDQLKSSRLHHRAPFLIRIKRWLMQAGSGKAARR